MEKKLYKSRHDVKLDGVCAGIGNYLGIDSTVIRIIWVIACFLGSVGVWAYILCAIIIPREPEIDNGYTPPLQ